MGADDGLRRGSPDVETTLVAALGFEPTSGSADDGATVLIDDAAGDGLDWSNGEVESPGDDQEIDLHAATDLADGFDAAQPASPTTAEAADAMTPPKGKGKGPQSFRRSSRARPTPKPPPMPDQSTALDPAAAGDDGTLTIGRNTDPDQAFDASGHGTNGQVDLDPADVVDPDFVDEFLPPAEGVAESGASPDSTAPIPAGLFRGSGSERGAHSPDPPPPTVDQVDERQSAAETLVVDGLTLETPSAPDTMIPAADLPPPTVDELPVADLPPPTAEESRGLFDAAPTPPPNTVIAEASPEAPPLAPPLDAPPVDAPLDAPPLDSPPLDAFPTGPPTVVPVAETSPSTAPPPPVADPGALPDPSTYPAGSPIVDPTAEVSVAARAGIVQSRGGEVVAKVPQLLDQGLLKRTRRVRARKVRRVVRHIDPWSVLTFSVLFFLCLFAALLLASVLVWNAAVAAGTIENIESFIREIGDYQTYEINGDVVFRSAMVIAGILTLAASVMLVLLVVVFNLISDLVGGIRVTVVEEETVRVRRRNQ